MDENDGKREELEPKLALAEAEVAQNGNVQQRDASREDNVRLTAMKRPRPVSVQGNGKGKLHAMMGQAAEQVQPKVCLICIGLTLSSLRLFHF
jgi:hypothetical protein